MITGQSRDDHGKILRQSWWQLFNINYATHQDTLSLDDASKVSDLVGLGRAKAVKAANMNC